MKSGDVSYLLMLRLAGFALIMIAVFAGHQIEWLRHRESFFFGSFVPTLLGLWFALLFVFSPFWRRYDVAARRAYWAKYDEGVDLRTGRSGSTGARMLYSLGTILPYAVATIWLYDSYVRWPEISRGRGSESQSRVEVNAGLGASTERRSSSRPGGSIRTRETSNESSQSGASAPYVAAPREAPSPETSESTSTSATPGAGNDSPEGNSGAKVPDESIRAALERSHELEREVRSLQDQARYIEAAESVAESLRQLTALLGGVRTDADVDARIEQLRALREDIMSACAADLIGLVRRGAEPGFTCPQ